MTAAALIFVAVICAAWAFLLSTAEAAFIRLTRREAEEIAEKHGSRAVEMILAEPVPHTLALQMWRWLFTTAAVVLITVTVVLMVEELVLAALIAAGVLLAGSLLMASISPRRIGRAFHVVIATAAARLVRALRLVLGPLPQVLARAGVRLVPGSGEGEQGFFDDEEFREFVARAWETDILEDSEAELIQSVVDLSDTRVRSVMVPRTDMVTVQTDTSLSAVMTLFLQSGYSRVPVTRGSADDITGMVYLKDVAFLEHQLRLGRAPSVYEDRGSESISVEELQRDVRYVPESKSASEFLSELQRESTHVAVVVDEYGGTAGLVTLEDLIEEIVGDIVDEYDTEDDPAEELDGGRMRLSARMGIDDFAELFGLGIDGDDEVDTVGGLLAKQLGRVPIAGSEVQISGRAGSAVVLRADRIEGRRNRVSHVLAWTVGGSHRGAGHLREQEARGVHESETGDDAGQQKVAAAEAARAREEQRV